MSVAPDDVMRQTIETAYRTAPMDRWSWLRSLDLKMTIDGCSAPDHHRRTGSDLTTDSKLVDYPEATNADLDRADIIILSWIVTCETGRPFAASLVVEEASTSARTPVV